MTVTSIAIVIIRRVAHGLVQIFIERCTRALISTCHSDVISWSDAVE